MLEIGGVVRDDGGLRLRPPRPEDEAVARAAQVELASEAFNFGFLAPDETWSGYLARLVRERRGDDLAPERVAAAFLYAEVGGQVVGRTSIRLTLNEYLLAAGGHIGYAVLPRYRRRGHATEILRQSLVIARAEGVTRVLVTCDEDNRGSIAVIERCGGRLDPDCPRSGLGPNDGIPKRRYWID